MFLDDIADMLFKTSDRKNEEVTEENRGTWKSSYSATDDEAHRGTRYNIGSELGQMKTVFMTQMKLFSKMKWTYLMLLVALLIPVIVLGFPEIISIIDMMFGMSGSYSTTYIGELLLFLPLFLGLITSLMCGTQIPQEFKDRTAYMNMALPMSRRSFYFGKYLAGFVMCIGIFMLAYGCAVATSMMRYDTVFVDLILESMLLTLVGIMAYSATAFCVGCFMSKGSAIVPFVLMSFVLPGVIVMVASQWDMWWLTQLPFFLGEAALGVLGAPISASAGLVAISRMDLSNIWIMILIGVVWTVVFLIIGLIKTERREM